MPLLKYALLYCNCAILLLLISINSHAVGDVYIQNNTSLAFELQTSQYGDKQLTKGSHWNTSSTSLSPWQKKKKALWYNRDSGITWGKNFYFDTRISIDGVYLSTLRQKLKGTMTFSKLYHSLESADFSHGWSQGYDIENQTFFVDGKEFMIKYSADYNAGTTSDDIVYAIHEVQPYYLPSADSSKQLKVLSYNLYTILTRSASDINTRMSAVVDVLSGYDVIVFEEAFHNSARENLIADIETEYPYTTDILDTSGYLEDGGVFIASKWPINTEAQTKYENCDGVDCLSPKGVMYASIQKQDQTYHIFGSHLQAENNSGATNARLAQLHELKSFIDEQNIPRDEAVIIAGDMNVDKNNTAEYQAMMSALNAGEPPLTNYSHHRTSDKDSNNMAGENSWLDYVLHSQDYKMTVTSEQAVLVFKSSKNSMFGTWDYSDHYAVFALYGF